MKRLIIIILCCAQQLWAQTDYSQYDNDQGTSMKPILMKADPIIKNLEQEKLEIVRMEFDIVTNNKKLSWRTLHKGVRYDLIAFGDYRVQDLDISLYRYENSQWVLVDKDRKEDSFAVLTLTPGKTEEYKIEISVYQFKSGYTAAHYGLLVTR
ncbi:MAG: hypothetical protein OER04_00250 [Cyclobacteriaceae bacterium]|nr:hypothetical protein [Cyclobacteriaceae bacterium]